MQDGVQSSRFAVCLVSNGIPVWLFGLCILVATSFSRGAVLGPYNGPSQTTFTGLGWSSTAVLPEFTQTYARLDSVSYVLYAAAEVTSSQIYNSGSFNEYPNVNGNATITLFEGSTNVGAAFLFPFGSGVIPPHSYGNAFGSSNQTVTGTLPFVANAQNSPFANSNVALTLTNTSGSGPNLQSIGSVQVSYNYTPIGLTQSDPILPASTVNGTFGFSAVPSGRWFDPATTSAYQYSITSSGDSFAGIAGLPAGFTGGFDVTANGVDYGPFVAGQSLSFPAGVTSFVVSGINPAVTQGNTTGFPIELSFNRDGVSFSATPVSVPEPASIALVFGVGSWLMARRPSRRMSSN